MQDKVTQLEIRLSTKVDNSYQLVNKILKTSKNESKTYL